MAPAMMGAMAGCMGGAKNPWEVVHFFLGEVDQCGA